MARNTQTVEIDLKSGITTNESLYSIGSRLWKATNSVWAYRYPLVEDSYSGPWAHRQPQTFYVPAGEVTYTGAKSMRDIAFHHNILAGSNAKLYPDATRVLSDNYTLSNTPAEYNQVINAQTLKSSTSPMFFERFTSDVLVFPSGATEIAAGDWHFNIYATTSNVTGTNLMKVHVLRRVVQTGITGTFTGSGATRTFTASGGTPFVAGDANADILKAGCVETATQTAWITGFTSSSVVTVTLTDPAFVNTADVSLLAIYYHMIGGSGTTADQSIDMSPINSVIL